MRKRAQERDARIEELEQRLERSEGRLEETQALTRVGSWEWPLPDGPATWSRELFRIYERDPAGGVPRIEELLVSIHPEDRQGVADALERLRTLGGDFDHGYRIIDSEGEIHYLHGRGRTVSGPDGIPIRSYGTTQDVSDAKRAEMRLEETQALARVGSWEWLLKSDDAWQATYSKEMLRIFGRDPEGPAPTRDELLAAVYPEDLPAFERLVERIQTVPGTFEHSYRIVDAQGRTRHMQARGFVEADPSGRPTRTHGTTQDITELKESQMQLERARRLEAVGQLVGGIAHDFNNLLSVILNYAECMIPLAEDPELLNGLREIERAALSGADLTRQLLLFSRRDSNEMRSVDLAAAVADTEEMLRRTIGDHVELTVDAPRGLSRVILGDGQAQQILVNLAVNARDALPQGGSIAVSVRELEGASSLTAPAPGLAAGSSYVVLTVSDDGLGMSEEVAAQAFDPFFTTKARGKGTGLGLATVYGIATRTGGHVEMETERGRGTAVSVFLPVSTQPERAEPAPREAPAPQGDGRTILVVDNEEAVRTIVSHMLRRHGYATRTAGSGSEAQDVLAELEGEVDLLLTDVRMPGASGKELAGHLRSRYPRLPIVYMSGYAGDEASPLGPWDDDVTILQKPFTAEQLLRAVGDALAGG